MRTSRRQFLAGLAVAAVGLAVGVPAIAAQPATPGAAPLTAADMRRAWKALKQANRSGPPVMILHPDVTYDLMKDDLFWGKSLNVMDEDTELLGYVGSWNNFSMFETPDGKISVMEEMA